MVLTFCINSTGVRRPLLCYFLCPRSDITQPLAALVIKKAKMDARHFYGKRSPFYVVLSTPAYGARQRKQKKPCRAGDAGFG